MQTLSPLSNDFKQELEPYKLKGVNSEEEIKKIEKPKMKGFIKQEKIRLIPIIMKIVQL